MSNSIIEFINETNIINFLIMAGILYWIIKKADIGSILKKSVQSVKNSIEQSENTKKIAGTKHSNSLSALEKLPQRIERIENFNKQKLEVFEEKISKTTDKTIETIKNNIDKVISVEEKKISAQVTTEAILGTIEKSKSGIIEKLKNNPELHNMFIDDSLDELDKAVIK